MEKFKVPSKLNQVLMIMAAIGFVSLAAGFVIDTPRAWAGLLVMTFAILSMALFGGFFVSYQYLSGSIWSVVLRRVPEVMMNLIPVALIFVAVIIAGYHNLYEWSHESVVAGDPILQEKAKLFLNLPTFIGVVGVGFILWMFTGFKIKSMSAKQDETKDVESRKTIVKFSAAYMLSFAYFFSLSAIYLVMSLEPHWQTTMFVVYTFAGLAYTGFGALIIFVTTIKKNGGLPSVNAEHFHDLGKFMFAFTAFWAYIGFSQHMLTWYANLPEETVYLENRLDTPTWAWFTVLLWVGHFIVPFFILLSSKIKRNPGKLIRVAWLAVFMGFLDIIWMVYGGLHDHIKTLDPGAHHAAVHGSPVNWMEMGIFIGCIGIIGYVVLNSYAKVNPEPIGDPFYEDSKKFHQSH